jgi:hypothetical protein
VELALLHIIFDLGGGMKGTTKSNTLRKGGKCPSCQEGKLILIVYGLPGRELMEQSGRGEIELGGCSVTEVHDSELGFISGDPELYCPKCEGRFFKLNEGA